MNYLRNDVVSDHVETRETNPRRPRRRVLTVAERWAYDPQQRRLRIVRDVADEPQEAA